MKTKTIKKSFELEDDMCNLYSEIEKNKNILPKELKGFTKSNSKRSNSRNNSSRISRGSTKDSPMNLSVSNQKDISGSNLMDLVDSLKYKLSLYENEIRLLLDEKVQMQITINNLQMAKRKVNKSQSRISRDGNDVSSADLVVSKPNNNNVVKEGLNHQLKILDENIQRQRNLIEQNYSILEDTVLDDRVKINDIVSLYLILRYVKRT
jgi:hypothetical protein